jgi:hypothetical protein
VKLQKIIFSVAAGTAMVCWVLFLGWSVVDMSGIIFAKGGQADASVQVEKMAPAARRNR